MKMEGVGDARWEMVLGHEAALARLLGEVVDLGEASALGVKAGEPETLVLDEAICALRWATNSHAEPLRRSLVNDGNIYDWMRTGGNAVMC